MAESKFKKMSVRFKENYNNKLYGKYFTTIRKKQYGISQGDFVDIILKDKCIMMAQAIAVNTIKFHELSNVTIQMDTGMHYADSLELFKGFGYNVNDFDLEVDYIFFECIQIYKRQPSAG